MSRILFKPVNTRAMRRSIPILSSLRPAYRVAPTLPRLAAQYSSAGPATIVDTGFWRSLVPKPLRKENRQALKSHYGKGWNPATFFIVIFLLIGSMSIQMIALRTSFDRYMRTSQIKIGLLREVVERIQNGEKVDVEKVLGTGEPEKEADWEEVLRAIEKDDRGKKSSKKEALGQTEPTKQEPTKVTSPDDARAAPQTVPAKKPSASLGSFF
jgi:hypothetical protein